MNNMKNITGCLAASVLALALSSCASSKSAGPDPGFDPNGPNDLVGLDPYGSSSTYGGGYQPPAYSDQNNDHVSVTPATPQNPAANPQMPAYQQSAPPTSSSYPEYAPYPPNPPAAGIASAGKTHVVQSGETLYRISKMYASSVEGIKNVNGLDSNLIRPGDVLSIP